MNTENKEREELLDRLVRFEYSLFSQVRNEGGRASCQDNFPTFEVMRRAQYSVWSTETIRSWLGDLTAADAAGRNLSAEKYAWMMSSTAPAHFKMLSRLLPPVSEEQKDLTERLIAIHLSWAAECIARHPRFRSGGRLLYTSEDTLCETSQETYLRGELYTYSLPTLRLLLKDYISALCKGRNLAAEVDDAMARACGYDSADAYEKAAEKG